MGATHIAQPEQAKTKLVRDGKVFNPQDITPVYLKQVWILFGVPFAVGMRSNLC